MTRQPFVYGHGTASPSTLTQRQARGAKLYGKAAGGSYDSALDAGYAKRESKLRFRGDREGLAQLWRERDQVRAAAMKRGITPAHLHAAMTAVAEREQYPLTPETQNAKWPQTFDELRMKFGSSEAAVKAVEAYSRVAQSIAAEVPDLAARMKETGAVNDLRVIEALAPYGAPPPKAA
jgi:hypothetical protein